MSVTHVDGLLGQFSFRVRSPGQTTPTCGDRAALLLDTGESLRTEIPDRASQNVPLFLAIWGNPSALFNA